MSNEKNEKTLTPKLKHVPSNFKECLARDPIAKQRRNIVYENSKKTETKNLYPDLSEYETEKESDEEIVTHKESCELPTKSTSVEYSFSKYCVIILLLGGILVCLKIFFGRKTEVDDISRGKTEVSITDLIKDMENHFKNQHELTYCILKSQLKKVIDKTVEPSAPAIITLVANKGAELTASEFSQHLVRQLAPETHLLINNTKYWDDEPDNIIMTIDEEIRSFANDDHLSVIVVDKVEKMSAEAAMIFHSYCDHEAAPYKRAIFLFIVPANKNIPVEARIKDIDRIAMNSLRDIWHEATNDKIDSLITRLTVSVVSIR